MSSKDLDNLETAPLDIKPESTDLQNSTSDAVIEEVETKPRRSRRITAKVEKDVKSEPSEVKTSTKRKKAAVAETQPSEPLGEGVLLKPLLIQGE
jgi:DNA-binding winged helix-turn-helix (wHTH) protein